MLTVAALAGACNQADQAATEETVLAAPAEATAPQPVPPGTEMPVQRVDSVMITRPQEAPGSLLIMVSGSVNTTGWTNPKLVPVESEIGDGSIRSFRLVATTPTAEVTAPVLQTLEARLQLDALPPEVRTIRIVAATNELLALAGN